MQRARVLIRLNTDQTYKAEIFVRAHVANDAIDAHASISFVNSYDFDIGVGAENLTPRTVIDEPIDAGQRVCRHGRPVPANDIAVVVIMRRFYEHDAEMSTCAVRCSRMPER